MMVTPDIERRIERAREHLREGRLAAVAYTISDVHSALLESQEDVEFLLSIVESFIPPPDPQGTIDTPADEPEPAAKVTS